MSSSVGSSSVYVYERAGEEGKEDVVLRLDLSVEDDGGGRCSGGIISMLRWWNLCSTERAGHESSHRQCPVIAPSVKVAFVDGG